MASAHDVTALLASWGQGNPAAHSELMDVVYAELKRLAKSSLRRESANRSFGATALVHEAYLRLVDQRAVRWQSRSHFFGVAAQAMRRILVDRARARHAAKRGGTNAKEVACPEWDVAQNPPSVDVLALDQALRRLEGIEPRWSRLVDLRFFAGLSIEETAAALDLSPATVKRDWSLARAWLYREIGTGGNESNRTTDGAPNASSDVRPTGIAADLKQMSDRDDWARVRRILEDIVNQPAHERTAYLAAQVGEPEIRREVESLLQAHDSAGNFLQSASLLWPDAPALPFTTAPLEPGTRVNSFEIVRPVGAGGMGQVYCARDSRLDRTVALKIIAPDLADAPANRERFEREARAISKLTHPHICVLYDIGTADLPHCGQCQFLVMELVEGETLRQRLHAGAVPLNQSLRYAIQIAEALAAAHSHKIVHGDLNPANIMLTKSGVKLLDFGLASFLQPEAASTEPDRIHGKNVVAGTLPYMCPEQLDGKHADAGSDIFSFGAVLFEMATGRQAFEAENRAGLISAIRSVPYRAGSLTPRSLDAIVETCLAKDPDNRWSNMLDVRLQLERVLQDAAVPATVSTTRDRQRPARWPRLAPWALAAAFGLGWMSTSVYQMGGGHTRARPTERLSAELGVAGSLVLTDGATALSP